MSKIAWTPSETKSPLPTGMVIELAKTGSYRRFIRSDAGGTLSIGIAA